MPLKSLKSLLSFQNLKMMILIVGVIKSQFLPIILNSTKLIKLNSTILNLLVLYSFEPLWARLSLKWLFLHATTKCFSGFRETKTQCFLFQSTVSGWWQLKLMINVICWPLMPSGYIMTVALLMLTACFHTAKPLLSSLRFYYILHNYTTFFHSTWFLLWISYSICTWFVALFV